MEFAGKNYIYLSKLKKDKIKKLQQSEKENEDDAPMIKEEEEEDEKEDKKEDKKEKDKISSKLKKYSKTKEKRKNSNNSIDLALSDDANLSVCSAEFDRDMEEKSNDSVNEDPAPMNQVKKDGKIYRKDIDTNICLIKYDGL